MARSDPPVRSRRSGARRQDEAEAPAIGGRSVARAVPSRPAESSVASSKVEAGLWSERTDVAAGALHHGIQLAPGGADSQAVLGSMLDDPGRSGEAVAYLRRALAIRPSWAEAHNDLGEALEAEGEVQDAIGAFQHAVALKPDLLPAHVHLGETLTRAGRLPEALAAFERAKALSPDFARTYTRLADVLLAMGQTEAAKRQYERALALDPDDLHARWQRGRLHLLEGGFERGWADWDARPRLVEPDPSMDATPRWAGGDVEGRALLVRGDKDRRETIQGVRFAPLLTALGARIALQVELGLRPLLPAWPGVTLAADDASGPFDAWAYTSDLARHLCPSLDRVPANVPYLAVGPARARAADAPLSVVLARGATGAQGPDRSASLPFDAVLRLARLPGLSCRSLEPDLGPRERDALRGAGVPDAWPRDDDLAALAAVVADADIVIAADNAIAHLAGALGRTLWLALPKVPDWRWLLGREDSPWYPTARLVRQTAVGDWSGVINRLESLLAEAAFPDG